MIFLYRYPVEKVSKTLEYCTKTSEDAGKRRMEGKLPKNYAHQLCFYFFSVLHLFNTLSVSISILHSHIYSKKLHGMWLQFYASK